MESMSESEVIVSKGPTKSNTLVIPNDKCCERQKKIEGRDNTFPRGKILQETHPLWAPLIPKENFLLRKPVMPLTSRANFLLPDPILIHRGYSMEFGWGLKWLFPSIGSEVNRWFSYIMSKTDINKARAYYLLLDDVV